MEEMIEYVYSLLTAPPIVTGWNYFWLFFPLWLPIITISAFWSVWIRYVRAKAIMKEGSILLELKIPKEILKSPAAMEIIIKSFSQPSVGTFIDAFLKGKVRPWFSLELVSLGGQVKFFIWSHKKWKNSIESQIYAQFPTVEIHEVPDYTLSTQFNEISMWGMQLALTKADPYPIKTYIDYGLDKDPKEEYKIDPITPLLEYLGSLKPDEQAWIQILIQGHRKEAFKDLRLSEKPDWKKAAKAETENILKDAPVKDAEGKLSLLSLSEHQKSILNNMQRNVSKTAFDTCIRCIYLSKPESFNPGNIGGLIGGFGQFGSGETNGFKPGFTTFFDYPWQDFKDRRVTVLKRKILDAYKRRSFFNAPYKNFHGKPFVLSTEELATIFHFPGGVASTPTFSRIVSKKGEAPSNLPI